MDRTRSSCSRTQEHFFTSTGGNETLKCDRCKTRAGNSTKGGSCRNCSTSARRCKSPKDCPGPLNIRGGQSASLRFTSVVRYSSPSAVVCRLKRNRVQFLSEIRVRVLLRCLFGSAQVLDQSSISFESTC